MSKKEQTKQLILEAAWQLFQKQGYQDTSTRDIATHAKVANGTVFSHFKSKIDILKAGFEAQLENVLLEASKTDISKTAADRMCHYANSLYPFYLSQREFSRELLATIMWQQDELAPQLARFKALLIHDNDANEMQAEIIIDLYFMTLLHGLNQIDSTTSSLIVLLTSKLANLKLPN